MREKHHTCCDAKLVKKPQNKRNIANTFLQ